MKKKFFRNRTLAEKKKLNPVYADNDLVKRILNLEKEEVIIINDLVPEKYSGPVKFLKHAPDVKLKRFYNHVELIRDGRLPYELIEEAFEKIDNPYSSYYSFKPFGIDKITRGVLPVDLLDAAQLYYYIVNHAGGFDMELSDENQPKNIEEEGACMTLRVSSRTEKKQRYKFDWLYFPIVDNENKFKIALEIDSVGYNSGDKLYNKALRAKRKEDKESSRLKLFGAHEIAGYWGICDYYFNKYKNNTPLQMSYFAIPTQFWVDFYKKIKNNVIIRRKDGKFKKELDKGNINILSWALIKKYKDVKTNYGHSIVFYSDKRIDGNLRDYGWDVI